MIEALSHPECGFREGKPAPHEQFERCWWFLERCALGDVRWCVQIRLWQHSKFSTPDNPVEDGWDCEGHFRHDGRDFTIRRSCRGSDPLSVIHFMRFVYDSLGCESWGVSE